MILGDSQLIAKGIVEKSIQVGHPNSKVHGANMGPTWGRLDPGGFHVAPMNFANWPAGDSFNPIFQINTAYMP